jgi:cell division septation protein DedD
VSGRIAATLPFPAAVSDFNAFIAEKSFVNDVTEMPGVEVPAEDVLVALVVPLAAALVVLLLFELPHPAATAATATVNTHTRKKRVLIPARSSHSARKTSTEVISWRRSSTPAGSTLANRGAVVHCD